MKRAARARSAVGQRGFTLIELLVVVAMIGVLAAIGLVGYRKYLSSAGMSEAVSMIQSIRAAEEAYKAETLTYLGCSSSLTDYYPQVSGMPDDKKWHWIQPNHPDFPCWNTLNAQADGAVRFGYAVVAGQAGEAPPPTSLAKQPQWPNPTREPWYVIQAAGDRDGDLTFAFAVGGSFAFSAGSGVITENETE